MRVTFRLGRLLDEIGVSQHGVIKKISEFTGIERHRVSGFLRNQEKGITFEELGKLCNYLIEKHKLPASTLTSRLFVLEPEDLWSLIAGSENLRICFGVRGNDPHYYVSWADSLLNGALTHVLFGAVKEPLTERPRVVDQVLVPAYGEPGDPSKKSPEDNRRLAQEADKSLASFQKLKRNSGFICLGSCKSNIVIESVIADIVSAPSFETQDHVRSPKLRKCPVFYRLRENDPHPPSCYAGIDLSKQNKAAGTCTEPGIYYEVEGDRWECAPWNDTEDAALVLYEHRPSNSMLKMVLGGFSGRATGLLADALPSIAKNLWPPQYNGPDLRVGVFVVRFKIEGSEPSSDEETEVRKQVPKVKTTVVRIAESAVVRRFEKMEPPAQ